jgi:NAD(P)-dependent dehydrogenase (short-subunit alcohol dehydrogenase family)
MRLEERTVVVTGGNSGIGRAIALACRGEGARVVVLGREPATLAETQEALGDRGLAVRGDVTRHADLERLFTETAERFGPVDVLVAAAGHYRPTPFEEIDEEAFRRCCDVNFMGAFFTVQAALPHLRRGASVILVTSTANTAGVPGLSVYGASKAAVRSLARTLSAELLPRGIRVNALSPGFIDTPTFERAGMSPERKTSFLEDAAGQVPMGRVGRPADVAGAAVFLASDDSSYLAGIELPVSGGLGEI